MIAALARESHPGIQAFTLSFPGTPDIDESPIARANARTLGLRHTIVPVTTDSLVSTARELVSLIGEPLGDAAALPLTMLARAAKERLSVVLTGEGADEIFGGYRRYAIDRFVSANPLTPTPSWVCESLDRNKGSSVAQRSMTSIAWGRRRGFRAHSALLQGSYAELDRASSPLVDAALQVSEGIWQQVSASPGGRQQGQDYDLTGLIEALFSPNRSGGYWISTMQSCTTDELDTTRVTGCPALPSSE